MIGKRHKLIRFMIPVQEKMGVAHGLAEVCLRQPTTDNALAVKVALENVQYEIDKLAMRDANKKEAV